MITNKHKSISRVDINSNIPAKENASKTLQLQVIGIFITTYDIKNVIGSIQVESWKNLKSRARSATVAFSHR